MTGQKFLLTIIMQILGKNLVCVFIFRSIKLEKDGKSSAETKPYMEN